MINWSLGPIYTTAPFRRAGSAQVVRACACVRARVIRTRTSSWTWQFPNMGYKASGPFSFNRHAAPVKVIGVVRCGGGVAQSSNSTRPNFCRLGSSSFSAVIEINHTLLQDVVQIKLFHLKENNQTSSYFKLTAKYLLN